jgi:hypothetical protein
MKNDIRQYVDFFLLLIRYVFVALLLVISAMIITMITLGTFVYAQVNTSIFNSFMDALVSKEVGSGPESELELKVFRHGSLPAVGHAGTIGPGPLGPPSEVIEYEKAIEESGVLTRIPLGPKSKALGNESIIGPTTTTVTNIVDPRSFLSDPCASMDFNCMAGNMTSIAPEEETTSLGSVSRQIRAIHYVDSPVTVPKDQSFMTNEPSVAARGDLVFYTGNVYAARSTDGGKHWQHIYVAADWDFDTCCDQDVIYDPGHDLFIWYRQGKVDPDTQENKVRIGVSNDTITWTMYDITPSTINPSYKGHKFDYPSLAVGQNYVYVTTDKMHQEKIGVDSIPITRTTAIVLRLSLDDMQNAEAARYSYYASLNKFTFTPVQGTLKKMYWATHVSNEKMRIYEWDENLPWNKIKIFDVNIPPFNQLGIGDAKCGEKRHELAPRNGNWCGQADSRISSGWYIDGLIGFFWNADAGGSSYRGATFPWPYVDAAVFDTKHNMSYTGRPYLWNFKYPYLYANASPNSKGELGVIAYYGNGKDIPPSLAFGVRDKNDINANLPWNMIKIKGGTHSPFPKIGDLGPDGMRQFSYEWGDYIRVRAHFAPDAGWDASGYVLEGGETKEYVKPYYFKIE